MPHPRQQKGNSKADDMAKRGANQHTTNQTRYYLANARKAVTKLAHDMMIDIWIAENEHMYRHDSDVANKNL